MDFDQVSKYVILRISLNNNHRINSAGNIQLFSNFFLSAKIILEKYTGV
jgi:hypothetical protein